MHIQTHILKALGAGNAYKYIVMRKDCGAEIARGDSGIDRAIKCMFQFDTAELEHQQTASTITASTKTVCIMPLQNCFQHAPCSD